MSALIVAIDGPSGTGKSTVSKQLAKRLRVPVLDTGAMYRTVALKALRMEVDLDDAEAVARVLDDLDLELRLDSEGEVEVLLDGRAVGQKIRTPEVTDASSKVSTYGVVRERMVALQRQVAERNGAVVEGRDIGSVVFPGTPYKFYLDAVPKVRAERRHRELLAAGRGSSVDDVLAEILRRDERDQKREDSPLRVDDSYFRIDTSDLRPPEIVERMVGEIRRLQALASQPVEIPPEPTSDLTEDGGSEDGGDHADD
ncbi:MAG: (d)CMP kinase [Acidobacteriota bacterium]